MVVIEYPEFVELDISVPELHMGAQNELVQTLGIKDDGSWLFGGAVSDVIYNAIVKEKDEPDLEIRDLDFMVQVSQIEGYKEAISSIRSLNDESKQEDVYIEFHTSILDRLKANLSFSDVQMSNVDYPLRQEPVLKLQYKGVSLDIVLVSGENRDCELDYDATVNSAFLRMDGKIFAAPDLVQHLRDGVYRYTQWNGNLEHAYSRLKKMREKYPGMKGIIDPETYIPAGAKEFFIRVGDEEYSNYLHDEWAKRFSEISRRIIYDHAKLEEDEVVYGRMNDETAAFYQYTKLSPPPYEDQLNDSDVSPEM